MLKVLPLAFVFCVAAAAEARQPPPPKLPTDIGQPMMTVTTPAPVEKINATTYRVGEMRLDTKGRTLVVPGFVNDVGIVEFIANTSGGFKAYESALTLNTNAVSFNAALLILGLDPARSRAAEVQFDRRPPEGDPVELTLSWNDGQRARTIDVEELLLDQRTKQTLQKGPWVYTGSTFHKGPDGVNRFLAEVDGVLIGFMHGPQAVIDNPRNDALNGFGYFMLNRDTFKPGTPITLTITVLPAKKAG